MASHNNLGDNSGMPLQQYTKAVPPGWRAGLPEYPLKRFLELLEVWTTITDVEQQKLGAAIVGRLVGRVQSLAFNLVITKQDQSTVRGMAALAFRESRLMEHTQPRLLDCKRSSTH